MAERVVLFDDVDADSNSSAIGWNGGKGAFVVSTYGAGTVTLYAADASGVYISLGASFALTAVGIVAFELPAGFTLRATIAGGGAAAGITASIVGP